MISKKVIAGILAIGLLSTVGLFVYQPKEEIVSAPPTDECGFAKNDSRADYEKIQGLGNVEKLSKKLCYMVLRIQNFLPYTADRGTHSFEILEVNVIEGWGIEVLARAYDNTNEQIGFGEDGTVDIERFKIQVSASGSNGHLANFVVEDINGTIPVAYNRRVDTNPQTLEEFEYDRANPTYADEIVMYRYDPVESFLLQMDKILKMKQQKHDSSNIVANKVGNTTYTFYTEDVSSYDWDGAWCHDTTGGWNAAHDAGASNYGDDARANMDCPGYGRTIYSENYFGYDIIGRGATIFDTSSIGASETISSATINLVLAGVDVTTTSGLDWATVVQVQAGNLVSLTDLATGDYDQIGDAIDNPTEGIDSGDRIDISSTGNGDYLFTLNSTGIGWIARSGETTPTGGQSGHSYFGFREGHDVTDTEIATAKRVRNYALSGENATASNKPTLTVETSSGGGGWEDTIIISKN